MPCVACGSFSDISARDMRQEETPNLESASVTLRIMRHPSASIEAATAAVVPIGPGYERGECSIRQLIGVPDGQESEWQGSTPLTRPQPSQHLNLQPRKH